MSRHFCFLVGLTVLLLTAACVACGLFVSALTDSQLVAAAAIAMSATAAQGRARIRPEGGLTPVSRVLT